MTTSKKGKLIDGNRYNKTSFSEKWADITKKQTRNLEPDDVAFLKAALLQTDKYARMAKDERTRIIIEEQEFQKYPVRGLVLISPNSKEKIWIGKKAITNILFPVKKRNRKKGQVGIVLIALRQIVEDDMRQIRNKLRRKAFKDPNSRCPLSNKLLSECKKTHVDHIYPFSKMAEDFFRGEGLDMEKVEVIIKGTYYYLKDSAIIDKWRAFHLNNAKLQLTCAKENIKKSNRVT